MLRPATPLGKRTCGAVHHITRTINPVSELDRTPRLLAAPADLRRIGDSARRLLSILTTIATAGSHQKSSRLRQQLVPMRQGDP